MLVHRAALLPALALLAGCRAGDPLWLHADPASLDLGAVRVGERADARLSLINGGETTVDLRALVLLDGDEAVWGIDGDTADLFPAARTELWVRFAPDHVGVARARLEIQSDDPVEPALQVALVGTGEPADGNPAPGDDTGCPDTGCAPGDTGDTGDTGAACGDADGDGHDLCDPGGDCDDADPDAFPVLVGAGAGQAPDGSTAAPFATVADALAHLDDTCREVVLLDGTHTADVSWNGPELTLRGESTAAVLTPPAGRPALTVGDDGTVHLASLTLRGARSGADGGALRIEGGTATLTGVRAVDNQSGEDGGAIGLDDGNLVLDRCYFQGNTAVGDGGAVYAWGASVVDRGSTWIGNTARNGGALLAHEGALDVSDARFEGNAASWGGAVAARDVRELAVERATFVDNTAEWRGGGLALDDVHDGLVRNSVVQGGAAGEEGGAVAVSGCTSLVLANSTLLDNAAGGEGGALWIDTEPGCATYAWSNLVAWSSGWSGVWVAETAEASVAYTLGWGDKGAELDVPASADAGGNLVGDPRFAAFSNDGQANDDLSLGTDSPAIDAGPPDGTGPAGHQDWADADGSRNDRGHTGGPGAR